MQYTTTYQSPVGDCKEDCGEERILLESEGVSMKDESHANLKSIRGTADG